MTRSKYSKRRGQFEALEAKQLFAADLLGAPNMELDTYDDGLIGLSDFIYGAEFDPGD